MTDTPPRRRLLWRLIRPAAMRFRRFLLGDLLREFAAMRARDETALAELTRLRERQEAAEVALVGLRRAVELGRDRVLEETAANRTTLRAIEAQLAQSAADRARPGQQDSALPRMLAAAASLERAALTLAMERGAPDSRASDRGTSDRGAIERGAIERADRLPPQIARPSPAQRRSA